MPIDVAPLWDFKHPEVSEQRFRSALQGAVGDDALILQTQIARTFGLRKDFATARDLLKNIEPSIATAGAEARVRYQLELGRTYASATHAPELLTPEAKERARAAYNEALQHRPGGASGRSRDRRDPHARVRRHVAGGPAQVGADSARGRRSVYAARSEEVGSVDSQQPRLCAASARPVRRSAPTVQRGGDASRAGSDAGATRVAYWMVAWTLRAMKRNDEALAIQLRLEREGDAAGDPDPYVFEELETLYREAGNSERAEFYANRRRSAAP